MAPRKEKSEKAPADQGAALILDYLKKQNRPYSATDISANLHNKVTKTNTAKLLKEMHERKEIEGRASGKQTVYHIPQSPTSEATPEELTAMDAEIQTLRDSIAAAKIQEKQLKLTLTTLTSTLSTADLQTTVGALENEKEELLGRLEILRKGDVKAVEKDEMERVEREWKVWKRNVAVRKGFCREMFAVVADLDTETQIAADQLWESMGLEGTLEDCRR